MRREESSTSSEDDDDWIKLVNAVSKNNRQLKCKIILGVLLAFLVLLNDIYVFPNACGYIYIFFFILLSLTRLFSKHISTNDRYS